MGPVRLLPAGRSLAARHGAPPPGAAPPALLRSNRALARLAAPCACTPQRDHVVRPRDTLSHLAARYLGDGRRWPELYRLNSRSSGAPARLTDPDLIRPGTKLRLPEGARSCVCEAPGAGHDAGPDGGPDGGPDAGVDAGAPEAVEWCEPDTGRLEEAVERLLTEAEPPAVPPIDAGSGPGGAAAPGRARPTTDGSGSSAGGTVLGPGNASVKVPTPAVTVTPSVEPITVDGLTCWLPMANFEHAWPAAPILAVDTHIGECFIRVRAYSRITAAAWPARGGLSDVLEITNSAAKLKQRIGGLADLTSSVGVELAARDPLGPPGFYAELQARGPGSLAATGKLQFRPPNSFSASGWFRHTLRPAVDDHLAVRVGAGFAYVIEILPRPPRGRSPEPSTEEVTVRGWLRGLARDSPITFLALVGLTGAALVAAVVALLPAAATTIGAISATALALLVAEVSGAVPGGVPGPRP